MRKDAKVNKKVALPEPLTKISRDLCPRLFLNVLCVSCACLTGIRYLRMWSCFMYCRGKLSVFQHPFLSAINFTFTLPT